MKILITGASGFIGSQLLIAACSAFGAGNVIAFSSKKIDSCRSIVYSGSDFNLDLDDYALLAKVEVLIHAGAFTPKSGQEANALKECNGNIHFTEKLLGLPYPKLKKILYLSTLDVYEASELTTETTPTLPSTLYGLSKLYCESMVSIFAAQNKMACQILRIGHVYGPGEEKYAKFLPKAIKDIVERGKVELWGDGAEIRSFIYIDDVVAAILNAVNLEVDVGVINIVGGIPISIRDLIDKLIVVSGRKVEIVVREFYGAKRNYIFDNIKLRQHLLADETDFMDGLRTEYVHIASLS